MSARRKKAKAWYGWALIVNEHRDPNMIFTSRKLARQWANPMDDNRIARVEIREVRRAKTRKGRRT